MFYASMDEVMDEMIKHSSFGTKYDGFSAYNSPTL